MGIQTAGDLVSLTSKFGILPSAEEDNFSPFDDKKFACANKSKVITTNMYVFIDAYVYACMYVCGQACGEQMKSIAHTHIKYIYVYIYMHVYIYICMYIYIVFIYGFSSSSSIKWAE